jgi:hypothetical protein
LVISLSAFAQEPVTAASGKLRNGREIELAQFVDRQIDAQLTDRNLPIALPADDATFIRRIYLDLTGRIPLPDEVTDFLENSDVEKRTELIQRLVGSPAFARHLADIWTPLILPKRTAGFSVTRDGLFLWLEQEFGRNTPWSDIAYELISSSGPHNVNPAVSMFMAGDSTTLSPNEATDLIARLFLGVQLQCAQCHDHPFAQWTQQEYWGMARFFERTDITNRWPEELRSRAIPTVGRKSEQGAWYSPYGVLDTNRKNPRHKPPMPDRVLDVPARFLNGEQPDLRSSQSLRRIFADWLVATENPWFAKAMVNRVWWQLFGRGLVMPVDDSRADNRATHPQLFDRTAQEFAVNGFDLQFLFKALLLTKAYERATGPTGNDDENHIHYAHRAARVMSSEQLFDSLLQILGEDAMRGRSKEIRWSKGARAAFVTFMTPDDDVDPIAFQRGVPQLLYLLNQRAYENALLERVQEVVRRERTSRDIVDQLYLLVLGRHPDEKDLTLMLSYGSQHEGKLEAYAGMLWALINSSEFNLIR